MSKGDKVDLGKLNNSKMIRNIGIILSIFIILCLFFLKYFTSNDLYNGKISKNVYIEDMDISDMTKSQAIDAVSSKYFPKEIYLEFESEKFEINPEEIDLIYNINEIVENAYNNTKTDSYVNNIINYIKTILRGVTYEIEPSYNEEKLNECIKDISNKINRKFQNAKIIVNDSQVNIIPSFEGRELDEEESKNIISKAIEGKKYNTIKLSVNITKPRISTEDIEYINTNLASFTTSFNAGQTNRAHNIGLSASRCNDVILLPGEKFSYNEHTGNRTLSNGYLSAPVIMGKELQDAPGGGVCQTSTTLFNAVLLSGLEITQVRNHSQTSSYASRGRDAMVNDVGSDLEFKNNFNHPVYIQCYRSGGSVTAAVYGSSADKVDVSISVDNFTYNGLPAAKTYRTIKKNGQSNTSYIYTSVYKK